MGKITSKAIRIDEGNFDVFLNEHPEIKYSIYKGTAFLILGPGVKFVSSITYGCKILSLEYVYNNTLYHYEEKI